MFNAIGPWINGPHLNQYTSPVQGTTQTEMDNLLNSRVLRSKLTQGWTQRAKEWAMRYAEGGVTREEQKLLIDIGNSLRSVRWQQGISLDTVAEATGIEPSMLCFLESGWATKEEYLAVIDNWTRTLGQDPIIFRFRLTLE